MFIHPLANVQSNQIGEGTKMWQYAVILNGAVVGRNCNINCHTFIEDEVVIGDNVTLKSGVYVWNGITIEDDVFIGPNVTFTNDKFPRSQQYIAPIKTCIKKGASIGANATIIAGITIGNYAMIGAASVVTKNIPAHALAYGYPAKVMGWVDEQGRKLLPSQDGLFISNDGMKYQQTSEGLVRK